MKTKGKYEGNEIQMIGTQLRKRRVQLGLTQQELADKLGVTKGGLSAYEQDKISPSAGKLVSLANILGVSIDFLYGNEDMPDETGSVMEGLDRHGKKYRKIATITDRQRGIGNQIVTLRTDRGYNTSGFARELGISEDMLIKYEKDLKYPPYGLLVKMAEVLDVSTEKLLGVDTGKTLYIGSLSDENKKLVKELVRSMR